MKLLHFYLITYNICAQFYCFNWKFKITVLLFFYFQVNSKFSNLKLTLQFHCLLTARFHFRTNYTTTKTLNIFSLFTVIFKEIFQSVSRLPIFLAALKYICPFNEQYIIMTPFPNMESFFLYYICSYLYQICL